LILSSIVILVLLVNIYLTTEAKNINDNSVPYIAAVYGEDPGIILVAIRVTISVKVEGLINEYRIETSIDKFEL
jgi:hypothetical protein